MPRTKEENERVRQERRKSILQGSLPVLAEKGLAATKISDLAKSAQISVGLFYSYFPSKEDIFVELINEYLESGQEMIEEIKQQKLTPLEQITQMFADLFNTSLKEGVGGLYFRLFLQISYYPQLWDRLIISDFLEDPVYKYLSDTIKKGQKEGTFRNISSDAISLILGYIALGINMNSLNANKLKVKSEEIVELIKAILLA